MKKNEHGVNAFSSAVRLIVNILGSHSCAQMLSDFNDREELLLLLRSQKIRVPSLVAFLQEG